MSSFLLLIFYLNRVEFFGIVSCCFDRRINGWRQRVLREMMDRFTMESNMKQLGSPRVMDHVIGTSHVNDPIRHGGWNHPCVSVCQCVHVCVCLCVGMHWKFTWLCNGVIGNHHRITTQIQFILNEFWTGLSDVVSATPVIYYIHNFLDYFVGLFDYSKISKVQKY